MLIPTGRDSTILQPQRSTDNKSLAGVHQGCRQAYSAAVGAEVERVLHGTIISHNMLGYDIACINGLSLANLEGGRALTERYQRTSQTHQSYRPQPLLAHVSHWSLFVWRVHKAPQNAPCSATIWALVAGGSWSTKGAVGCAGLSQANAAHVTPDFTKSANMKAPRRGTASFLKL